MKGIIISSAPQVHQANPQIGQQMKTTYPSIRNEQIQFPAGRNGIQRLRPWCSKLAAVALAAAALLTAASSPAAQLTWDAGNTNNGATIDAASGFWDLTYPVTNFTAATATTATTNDNLGAGGLDWILVNVPANAVAATNILLYATNLPVNVWFSINEPPTTNGVGDALLMAGVTSGVSVLTTNSASAPTNILPGGFYYIGIDNSANIGPVGYALQLDLSLINPVVTTSTRANWNTGSGNVGWTQTSTTSPLNGATFAGPDAAAETYQIALDGGQIAWNNLTINANGYVFSGATMYQLAGNTLSVSNGVNVTFSNNITGPNTATSWRLGTGGAAASMTVLGNVNGLQLHVGSTNGSTLWLGGNMNHGVFTANANVTQTNGTFTGGTTWQVGRPGFGGTWANSGTTAFPGVFTLDGPSAIMNMSGALQISRGGGSGTVIIKNGTVNMGTAAKVAVMSDGGGQGSFFMQGGTLNMGNSTTAAAIALDQGGAPANSVAIFSQSGGTIYAWGGVLSGAATGTFANSTSAFTNSGGFLYIGSSGISRGTLYAPTNYFVFSGGTVGALRNWISTVPLTLDTLNGNITFQCEDDFLASYNIALSGALTGPGGLNKTGSGTLTLSGANNYAGSTVVNNGILRIVSLLSPTNGSLTLDGSANSPTVSVAPASAGQFMTVNGDLTYAAGTVTANFDFGALPPSTSLAPIQVTTNVVCTVTPAFTIVGSAIPVGTYPLIKYGGTVSGSLPATPTVLPASTGGYITNIIGTKTIALVVTSSPVSASLTWRVGSGGWGLIPALNWSDFGSPINYAEPNAVQFDDTASGPFPVTVTNLSAVSPSAITVLGTNVWTILGNGGSIDGSASLTKAGNGTVTLTGTNTYSGGTTISGGQLDINNGGTSAANSAIGTGPLTLALGAKVDNTSGQSVTLQPAIVQSWLDDWTFVGSTNLNTGAGAVTLGNSVVVLTVVSSTLEVDGSISDNSNNYKLEKAGNGTLTLGTDSYFTGGMQLDSGLLQLKTANGLGNGSFVVGGSAALDNLSGADMTLTGITGITVPGGSTFTYLGTSNSLDFGTVPLATSAGTVFWNVVSNKLTCGGNFTSGNNTMVKIGQGKLVLGGFGSSQYTGDVNEGELVLAHDAGSAIGTGGASAGYGILVQSNALCRLAGLVGNQIPNGAYNQTRLNAGGILDMNGNSETVDMLSMTNGVLRNSVAATISTLTVTPTSGTHGTNAVILTGVDNVFDVPSADAELDIAGNVTGTGALVKTGPGIVNLQGANSYTNNTTITDGTLVINSPFLAATSTVTVNTNATLGTNGVLTLNFAGAETNTVAALVLGGVSKPNGVYSATTDPAYLAGAGSLLVVPPVTINPLPGTIQFSLGGSTLALSWPTNLGWILQSQTNALNVGLVTNSSAWFNVPGSGLVTTTNIPINPANGAVFYRMIHP